MTIGRGVAASSQYTDNGMNNHVLDSLFISLVLCIILTKGTSGDHLGRGDLKFSYTYSGHQNGLVGPRDTRAVGGRCKNGRNSGLPQNCEKSTAKCLGRESGVIGA